MKRVTAIILAVVLLFSCLPMQAFAAEFERAAAEVREGVFTASDGEEYVVLYNDYITLYVSKSSGGFAILPSSQAFDDAKPLSYATFNIDGASYVYGGDYAESGIVSIAPAAEEGVIRSDYQVEDVVITQIFALTKETNHESSYVVKIGYAAQYFGNDTVSVAGRILLDTQFTPDEGAPLMIRDEQMNPALVETEVLLAPVPSVAMISAEIIREANDSAAEGDRLYTDAPNKGYMLFDDAEYEKPDALVFTSLETAHEDVFECDASYGSGLFDGTGADSAAVIYWDGRQLTNEQQLTIGTSYGFYQLVSTSTSFESAPQVQAVDFDLLAAVQTAKIQLGYDPGWNDWISIVPSVSLTYNSEAGARYDGIISSDGGNLSFKIDYADGALPEFKEAYPQMRVRMFWRYNDQPVYDQYITMGSSATVSLQTVFANRDILNVYDDDGNYIGTAPNETFIVSVDFDAVLESPKAGWKHVSINTKTGFHGGLAKARIAETTGIVPLGFLTAFEYGQHDYHYLIKPQTPVTAVFEMASIDFMPRTTNGPLLTMYKASGDEQIQLFATASDSKGPLEYTYTFNLPNSTSTNYFIIADIDYISTIFPAQPININVYSDHFSSADKSSIRGEIYDAVDGEGLSKYNGLIWTPYGEDKPVITISADDCADILAGHDDSSISAYKFGTTELVPLVNAGDSNRVAQGSDGYLQFKMPEYPVEIAFEDKRVFRVATTVECVCGETHHTPPTATVTLNTTKNGATPLPGDWVYVYITNIENGYVLYTDANGPLDSIAVTSTKYGADGSGALAVDYENSYGVYSFQMPYNDAGGGTDQEKDNATEAYNVNITVKLYPAPATPAGDPHSITVLPLAVDGEVYYDVSFWTNPLTSPDRVYKVDEAGLSGKVRAGENVRFVVYPTQWSGDIMDWVVSGITIKEVVRHNPPIEVPITDESGHNQIGTELVSVEYIDVTTVKIPQNGGGTKTLAEDFIGINTPSGSSGLSGLDYYPYDYTPGQTEYAGTFEMPGGDVVIEITGYRDNTLRSMKIETRAVVDNFDQLDPRTTHWESILGERLAHLDQNLKSTRNTAFGWKQGTSHLVAGEGAYVLMPRRNDKYSLEMLLVIKNGNATRIMETEALGRDEHWACFFIDAIHTNGSTLVPLYKDTSYMLNITGYEQGRDGAPDDGTEQVAVFAGNSNTSARNVSVVSAANSEYTATITLKWKPGFGNAAKFFIPLSGANYTATPVTSNSYSATYNVTLTGDADVEIERKRVPSDLDISLSLINSANTALFADITLAAGAATQLDNYGSVQYKNEFSTYFDSVPTRLTSITLNGISGDALVGPFSKSVTTASDSLLDDYASYFAYTNKLGGYTGVVTTPKNFLKIDLRGLLGIGADVILPSGEYELTLEWLYGEGYLLSNTKTITFELGSSIYKPGEMKYLGFVQLTTAYDTLNTGDWTFVTGTSYSHMMANCAEEFGASAEVLLYFYCKDGFIDNLDGTYSAEWYADVVMNGAHYLKPRVVSGAPDMVFRRGTDFIDPDDPGAGEYSYIEMEAQNYSIGSKNVTFWYPFRIGNYGADKLQLRLADGKVYEIPDRYPIYEKDQFGGNSESAKAYWQAQIDEIRENTVLITPVYDNDDTKNGIDFSNGRISLKIAGFDTDGGFEFFTREMYLLGEGLDLGGVLDVTFPFAKNPLIRMEVVSVSTKNDATIPIRNVWAEGQANINLPEMLGGMGFSSAAVFNTYTQDFGMEGELNLWIVVLGGSFYLARSERLHIPFIDSWSATIAVDGVIAGFGLPPAPLQVIEIQGVSLGFSGLADTIDYDPSRNIFPRLRVEGEAVFSVIEIIGFTAGLWFEMAASGTWYSAGVQFGPLSFDILEELRLEMGVQDGPFEPYSESAQSFFVKGRRSCIFYYNFVLAISYAGLISASGSFKVSLKVSPALWEKQGGFADVGELLEFINTSISISGHFSGSVLGVGSAEISPDISIGIGQDIDYAPLKFNTLRFSTLVYAMGMKLYESEVDVLKLYPGVNDFVKTKAQKEREAATGSASVRTMSTGFDITEYSQDLIDSLFAPPEQGGVPRDIAYQGSVSSPGLGASVASSELVSGGTARGGISPLAITQGAGIQVKFDGQNYTHTVTVPSGGKSYVLQLESYGGGTIDASELRVYKPNGQPLIIREVAQDATPEQVAAGYNAMTLGGVLMLSLSDFKNDDGANDGATVTGVSRVTLDGEWQVVSANPFKSNLVELTELPGIASAVMSDVTTYSAGGVTLGTDGKMDTLTITFENLDNDPRGNLRTMDGNDYFYSVTLEKMGDPTLGGIESSMPLVVNEKLVSPYNPISINLDDIEYVVNEQGGTEKYSMSEFLDEGTWYPKVVLKYGKIESFSVVNKSGVTEVVDDLTLATVDTRVSTLPYVAEAPAPTVTVSNLTATAGGNQTIKVSFDAAQPDNSATPDVIEGAVTSYEITVYDTKSVTDGQTVGGVHLGNSPGMRIVTDGNGVQRTETLQFVINVNAEENLNGTPKTAYEYVITEVPQGSYKVGVTPYYNDVIEKTDQNGDPITPSAYTTAPISRAGVESVSSEFDISVAVPPVPQYSITGGYITYDSDGTINIYGGEGTILSGTGASGETTTFYTFDGTEIAPDIFKIADQPDRTPQAAPRMQPFADSPPDYRGQTIIAITKNAAGDTTTDYLRINEIPQAPRLDLDGFVLNVDIDGDGQPDTVDADGNPIPTPDESGHYTFVAYRDTGKYFITGTTDPGALLSGGVAGTDGRFSIEGKLEAGTDEEFVTISVSNEFGMTTSGEAKIVRGNENEPRSAPSKPLPPLEDEDEPEAPPVFENPFTDVSEGEWYYDDVAWAVENGLMQGDGNGRFMPDEKLTRGMIVTMLYRYAGSPGVSLLENPFDDVRAAEWYYNAIKWASSCGIVNGYGDGLFGPEDYVLRQDLAVILDRFAAYSELELPVLREYEEFADADRIDGYAKEAVERFYEAGVINGKLNHRFDPQGTATRAETAAMLRRLLGR